MICHVCGAKMNENITDLPFKTNETSIVVVKEIPVFQCESCREYVLSDKVMKQLDEIFAKINNSAELEIIRFAA